MTELELITTKKELKKVVSAMLLQCPSKDLVIWLLKRHPNKEKLAHLVPTMTFSVTPDRTGAPKLTVNGDTISWVSCINMRIKVKDPYRDELISFMRVQRDASRALGYPCHICHGSIQDKDFTLDHVPGFDELKKAFKLLYGESEIIDLDQLVIFEDRTYAEKWYEYHKDNAKLYPAHGKCNTRRYHASRKTQAP
jgi:hypothetical protein